MVPTSFLAPVNNLQPLCFSASIGHTCVLLLTCLWGFAHRMPEAMFLRIMPLALAMLVIKNLSYFIINLNSRSEELSSKTGQIEATEMICLLS